VPGGQGADDRPAQPVGGGDLQRRARRDEHVHADEGGPPGLDGADPDPRDRQIAEARPLQRLHAGDDGRRGRAVEKPKKAGQRHPDRDGDREQDDEGHHRRVDVGGGPGVPGARQPGGEEEAGEDPARDGGIDRPGLDVGGDERACRAAAEREDDPEAGERSGGGVEGGRAELDGTAARGERDCGVDEREGGDAEDEQALHRVDERLEGEIAEGVALVVGPVEERRHPEGEERRHREAEVEEPVEQDGPGAGRDGCAEGDRREDRGGGGGESQRSALGTHVSRR
jgi:hypothetical protein